MTDVLKRVPQDLWRQTPSSVFRTDLTARRFAELELLRRHALPLGEICRVNYGAQISSRSAGAFGRERYLSRSSAQMADPKRFYEGSNMRPFTMSYDGTWVDMGAREEMYGPRTPGFFEADKLSIRHISGDFDSFVGWIDEERYYTDHGVIHAVPYHAIQHEAAYRVTREQVAASQRYPLFYLLGVLMSRTAMELYAELYATGSLQGAFSHVYPNMLKSLPIPRLERAPAEAPPDWSARLADAAPQGRLSRAALRRAFGGREELAAVLAAAARERQALELGRDVRRRDFASFMQVHSGGWRWRRGESFATLPDEDAFLHAVGESLASIVTTNAVRTEYRQATDGDRADGTRVEALQATMDALADALYAGARGKPGGESQHASAPVGARLADEG